MGKYHVQCSQCLMTIRADGVNDESEWHWIYEVCEDCKRQAEEDEELYYANEDDD